MDLGGVRRKMMRKIFERKNCKRLQFLKRWYAVGQRFFLNGTETLYYAYCILVEVFMMCLIILFRFDTHIMMGLAYGRVTQDTARLTIAQAMIKVCAFSGLQISMGLRYKHR